MYSNKIIQNLKPQWYLDLSTKEKLTIQKELAKTHSNLWKEKPVGLKKNDKLIAKHTIKNITKDRTYFVINYFATLVTTVYGSQWNEFVTLKNDKGYVVKMNLHHFII